MPPLSVSIKHAGKSYPVELDTSAPPSVFKDTIFQATGVPPDKVKVLIKGGYLKDDTDWRKVAPKAGQTFMVIGTAGQLPPPPVLRTIFQEDIAPPPPVRTPEGLINRGNTCYMNSTVQVLRVMPELHAALATFNGCGGVDKDLVQALKDLYRELDEKTGGITPDSLLNILRQAAPQFGEYRLWSYVHQDADACWAQILKSMSNVPVVGISGPASLNPQQRPFVEQFLGGEMIKTLTCDEAPDEPPTLIKETFVKLEFSILDTTEDLHIGLGQILTQKVKKMSPSLGREATYTAKAQMSRLPNYLTVHMDRFYWKRGEEAKAKITSKVQFPFNLDLFDSATEDLKTKLQPLNTKYKEIDKNRYERVQARYAAKGKKASDALGAALGTAIHAAFTSPSGRGTVAIYEDDMRAVMADEPDALEVEKEARGPEVQVLQQFADPSLVADTGASLHGIYELCGVVSHEGPSAEGGHYIGWAKKPDFDEALGNGGAPHTLDRYGAWYKFDDARVTVVQRDKIRQLEGGGEESMAYILLYRSKRLDWAEPL